MLSIPQQDQLEANTTLKAIHEGLEIEEPFQEWIPRVRFFYPAGSGGLALAADKGDPDVWWAHLYSPGAMPKVSSFQEVMKLAAALGCKVIAVHVESPIVARLLKRLGLQQIEEDLFAIKCQ